MLLIFACLILFQELGALVFSFKGSKGVIDCEVSSTQNPSSSLAHDPHPKIIADCNRYRTG